MIRRNFESSFLFKLYVTCWLFIFSSYNYHDLVICCSRLSSMHLTVLLCFSLRRITLFLMRKSRVVTLRKANAKWNSIFVFCFAVNFLLFWWFDRRSYKDRQVWIMFNFFCVIFELWQVEEQKCLSNKPKRPASAFFFMYDQCFISLSKLIIFYYDLFFAIIFVRFFRSILYREDAFA